MPATPQRKSARFVWIVVVIASVAISLLLGAQKNLQPQHYLQLIIDGIRGGSIYALMALGFVVVYTVTGIINFAQGEFVMLGAMICISMNELPLPLPPAARMAVAIIGSIILTTLIGIAVERTTIHPARRSSPVTLIIITVGVTITLRAVALLVWGADPHVLPAFTTLALEDTIFRFAGVTIQAQSLWIWGTLAVILILLYFFLERTIMGKALRACAVNRKAAQLMGISPSRMSMLSFGMAAALGAIGGIVLGPVTRPIYDMGMMLGLRGFVAAIIGGLVSVPGVVAGGLLLGVVENIAAGVTDPAYKSVVSFIILIAILLFRPQGLIGGGEKPAEEFIGRAMKFLSEHRNTVSILIFTSVIFSLGAVDILRPLGLRFSDLTGRVVTLDSMIRIGILTIVLVGLNLLMGYAGQVSLGQAGFYAMGAYASAILTTLAVKHQLLLEIADTWWWPWLVMVIGMAITGGFAYLVGKPILRLKGNYLAMATLGLGFIIYILGGQFPEITGGYDGLTDIPRLRIGEFLLWPMQRYYFLVWGVAILVILIALNIVNSRIGRALRAIHTNEMAANTSGVDTERFKVQIFVISAIFASLAGSLYAHFQSAVSPNPFSFRASVELVTMAAVGGLSSIWGAPFGVGSMFILGKLIQSQMESVFQVRGGEYELIVYGIVLVVIMIFMPEGLTTASKKTIQRLRRRPEPTKVREEQDVPNHA